LAPSFVHLALTSACLHVLFSNNEDDDEPNLMKESGFDNIIVVD
jgi:hypothetical protein